MAGGLQRCPDQDMFRLQTRREIPIALQDAHSAVRRVWNWPGRHCRVSKWDRGKSRQGRLSLIHLPCALRHENAF